MVPHRPIWLDFAGIHAQYPLTYRDIAMQDDERCRGAGTCIIEAHGRYWCGQQWDGEEMCRPTIDALPHASFEPDLAMPAGCSDPE